MRHTYHVSSYNVDKLIDEQAVGLSFVHETDENGNGKLSILREGASGILDVKSGIILECEKK